MTHGTDLVLFITLALLASASVAVAVWQVWAWRLQAWLTISVGSVLISTIALGCLNVSYQALELYLTSLEVSENARKVIGSPVLLELIVANAKSDVRTDEPSIASTHAPLFHQSNVVKDLGAASEITSTGTTFAPGLGIESDATISQIDSSKGAFLKWWIEQDKIIDSMLLTTNIYMTKLSQDKLDELKITVQSFIDVWSVLFALFIPIGPGIALGRKYVTNRIGTNSYNAQGASRRSRSAGRQSLPLDKEEDEMVSEKVARVRLMQERSNDVRKRGEEIYQEKQSELEAEHAGQYVVIDLDSREYVAGTSIEQACKLFRSKFPHSPSAGWLCKVGSPASASQLH